VVHTTKRGEAGLTAIPHPEFASCDGLMNLS